MIEGCNRRDVVAGDTCDGVEQDHRIQSARHRQDECAAVVVGEADDALLDRSNGGGGHT